MRQLVRMEGMKPFKILLGVQSSNGGLGINGKLPWKRKEGDMAHVKNVTMSTNDPKKKNLIFCGRTTYESFSKRGPLKDRINVVLSLDTKFLKDIENIDSLYGVRSFDELYELVGSLRNEIESIFCLGGVKVAKQALTSPYCEGVILSKIPTDYDCDTYFTEDLSERFICDRVEDQGHFQVEYWERNVEEDQYLKLISKCIKSGFSRSDRTGVGTLGHFGEMMKFDLSKGFPLFTTKRVFWKGVAKELLWFIKGSTDARLLKKEGVGIWDANGTRSFLDSRGLDYPEGTLGPVYGFQWRFFGANYKGSDIDYSGQGVDQLQQCIDTIKKNPNSRRIIMSAWNPVDIPKMALPPCHVLCQFSVENEEILHTMLYQRSCDLGLGVPFNVASYALLAHMVAHLTNLKVGTFTHVLGDAHVYSNHVEPLQKQLARIPKAFPTLTIQTPRKSIDDFTFEDFVISDYKPYRSIKMKMAV